MHDHEEFETLLFAGRLRCGFETHPWIQTPVPGKDIAILAAIDHYVRDKAPTFVRNGVSTFLPRSIGNSLCSRGWISKTVFTVTETIFLSRIPCQSQGSQQDDKLLKWLFFLMQGSRQECIGIMKVIKLPHSHSHKSIHAIFWQSTGTNNTPLSPPPPRHHRHHHHHY